MGEGERLVVVCSEKREELPHNFFTPKIMISLLYEDQKERKEEKGGETRKEKGQVREEKEFMKGPLPYKLVVDGPLCGLSTHFEHLLEEEMRFFFFFFFFC